MVSSLSGVPIRLLVVSGHPVAAGALSAHLSRHGFDVVASVSDARAAAEAAARLTPDIALVDADTSDGWRSIVAALEGALSHQRIAVLAAYWSQQERRDANLRGIGATLLKRVDDRELAGQLRLLAA